MLSYQKEHQMEKHISEVFPFETWKTEYDEAKRAVKLMQKEIIMKTCRVLIGKLGIHI